MTTTKEILRGQDVFQVSCPRKPDKI